MRRRSPFTVVSASTPLAGYDPVGEPSDAAKWRMACFAKLVHVADAPALGAMLAAWRGEPRPDAREFDWRGLLEDLDVEATKRELKAAGVEVVVAKDPGLHGFVASVVGTEVPGDLLLENALEGWLKALALARHQAAVGLPRLGGAPGDPSEPDDAFRRRLFAEAVRDLSPTQMDSAVGILAEMPTEPGGPEPQASFRGWSLERLETYACMTKALRDGDRAGFRAAMDALKDLPPATAPTTWSELADGLDVPTLCENATRRGWEVTVRDAAGTNEALLNGEPAGLVGEESEVTLKVLALAQHEGAVNLLAGCNDDQ